MSEKIDNKDIDTSGKIKSTVDGTPIETVFDYGDITKRDKDAMQGYRETADKDGKRYRIPHIGFSADLDYLDDMAQRLAKKIMTISKESNETNK
jgi:hypothetical protein